MGLSGIASNMFEGAWCLGRWLQRVCCSHLSKSSGSEWLLVGSNASWMCIGEGVDMNVV